MTKVVNDTSVTAIYFREVPNVVFMAPGDNGSFKD
jgi:hypothetical protein